jgi:hypothetical protein
MQKLLLILFLVSFFISCTEEDNPLESVNLETSHVEHLSGKRYRLYGKLENGDLYKDQIRFKYGNSKDLTFDYYENKARYENGYYVTEIDFGEYYDDAISYYKILINGNNSRPIKTGNTKSFVSYRPLIDSISHKQILDFSEVSVFGKYFGTYIEDKEVVFYFKLRSLSGIRKIKAHSFISKDSILNFVSPRILMDEPESPFIFEENLTPVNVFLEVEGIDPIKLATLEYFYLMNILGTQVGKAGDIFKVALFYSKDDVSSKFTFKIGDTELHPVKVESQFDFTSNGFIYGNHISFEVPDISPGNYQIKGESIYGDQIIIKDNIFTIE